jgi:hypothetical protein
LATILLTEIDNDAIFPAAEPQVRAPRSRAASERLEKISWGG